MALFLLLLSPICFLLCEGSDIKIINGDEVVPHSRPYMALIETPDEEEAILTCGGSLIESDWVLTAAHCNLKAGKTTVILGAHSWEEDEPEKQTFEVIKLYVYKPFNSTTKEYDIQLVQLSEKAKIGEAVKTLPLPESFEDPKKGTVCTAAGWGDTETGDSDKLMETNITILDRETCQKRWGKLNITTDMICTNVGADRKSACKGDSGGPLICNGVFRGLTSFARMPCGTPGTSNIFTRLSKKYVEWIRKTISQNSNENKNKEN